jgi:DNA-binding NtrC family response regulator
LVVDDEESVRRSFDLIFRDDYEVVTAPDGEMALATVRDLMPNLMFLDIRMPGMGGLEVLAEARRIDEDLEVVVVTAVSDVATAIEAMKLGAFSYVIKPFDVDAIRQLASRALLKHRINLENRRCLESLTHENVRLRTQRKRLKRRLQATSHELHEMREGLAQASKLAALGEVDEAKSLLRSFEQRGRALRRTWALAAAARCRALLRVICGLARGRGAASLKPGCTPGAFPLQ